MATQTHSPVQRPWGGRRWGRGGHGCKQSLFFFFGPSPFFIVVKCTQREIYHLSSVQGPPHWCGCPHSPSPEHRHPPLREPSPHGTLTPSLSPTPVTPCDFCLWDQPGSAGLDVDSREALRPSGGRQSSERLSPGACHG